MRPKLLMTALTAMRDTALAKENARIRAIKPALPFDAHGLLPGLL